MATIIAAGACGDRDRSPGDGERLAPDRPAAETVAMAPTDRTRGDVPPAPDRQRAGASTEPDRRESAAAEPATTQPATTESATTQSAATEPPPPEPVTTEPATVEAAPKGSEAASTQPASPDSILRATSRAYEGLRSFRAEFEQTLRNTLLGRTTSSEGTVYQRQPDRFLMDFSEPPDDLIVSDGEWFWMYFPSVDAKQVIRTRRGAQGLDLHAQFIGDPVRRFETTYHGMESVRGRASHVMTLVPREAMGYERLKVWIDAEDQLVRRFELTETNGNVRHFELRDLVANPSLSDDLFEFAPPAGAQVVTR